MDEESDKTRALNEAYAEMIINTTKESAARVLISDRKSSQIHYNLNETKDEAVRLLVRLKQMIDAKTDEAEITLSNKQREIDLLEAQLEEAEDIITDLRLELSWVRDRLEKVRNVVNKEEEVVVVDDDDDDDECGVTALKACGSEVDGEISNKKLELSLNGCTQRIHALERKSSCCVSEEERRRSEIDGEENFSLVKTRCLVLALRSRNAELVTMKPLNGIKKSRKVQGRKKRRWAKRKATLVRCQSQSQSDLPCSKTTIGETHLSVENEEVDVLNACNGLDKRLQCNADGIGIIRKGDRSKNVEILSGVSFPVNPTDHMVETKLKPCPCLNPGSEPTNATVISVNAMNQSTEKDLNSRKEDESKCEGEECIVVSSTKMVSDLVNPSSDLKAKVVPDKISESSRTNGNRLMKYTFQRKRKREQKGGR